MNECLVALNNIEKFLGSWNDSISLIGCLLSICITFKIYKKEQQIMEEHDRQCIVAIIEEVGMQYSNLRRTSNGFWKIYCNAADMSKNENLDLFLEKLYDLKKQYSFNWVSLPLHKLNIYEDVLDNYKSRFIRLYPNSYKMNTIKLIEMIEQVSSKFKKCIQEQKNIEKLIPSLAIFFNDEKYGSKIIEIMNNSKDFDSFKGKVKEISSFTENINWAKIKEIIPQLREIVKNYTSYQKSVKTELCNFCAANRIDLKYLHMKDDKYMDDLILVDTKGAMIGHGEKMQVHRTGQLHCAFSVFIIHDGKMLLQRRAPKKYHSGGLWTNACCSHPRYGEDILEAVSRRLQEELGIISCQFTEKFHFIYRTEFQNGIIEYEYDHVFLADCCEDVQPDSTEIAEVKWVDFQTLRMQLLESPQIFTSWFLIAAPRILDSIEGICENP